MSNLLPWFNQEDKPLYLAPMARYTDYVYRQICKDLGADVMVSEFVLADSLLRDGTASWETIDFSESQRPMGVQLFGSNPEPIAEAARRVRARMNPDFIDLNFGCPASRITGCNGGSSLLKNLKKFGEIITQTKNALGQDYPLTCKIRIGWDAESIIAVEAAQIAESCGASAVAVHGRTREQGYSGKADWSVIQSVCESVKIPVIGNGDVSSAEQVIQIYRTIPVAGMMIGRAALGYPWIFQEIKYFLKTGQKHPSPTLENRWELILEYAQNLLKRPARKHKKDDIRWMRPRLIAMTKEMNLSKQLRGRIGKAKDLATLHTLKNWHLEEVASREATRR